MTSAIDDGSSGADSPSTHITAALAWKPTPPSVSPDLHNLMQDLTSGRHKSLQAQWAERAAIVASVCSDSRGESDKAIQAAHPEVANVLRRAGPGGANPVALDRLMALIGAEDRPGAALLEGLPLVGDVAVTHAANMKPFVTSIATVDPADLLHNGLMDQQRVRAAVEGPSPMATDRETAIAIWESTKLEITAGLLSPAVPFSEAQHSLQGPLTVRFGVRQVSSKGQQKVRNIDDFAASSINQATSVYEKLRHDHHDDLLATCSAIAASGARPVLIKADFKGAYRTIPLRPADAAFANVLVFNTDVAEWMVVRQTAAPFGALSSVYHWERAAAAVTTILRWIGLPVLRYVDDLFMAVPADLGSDARAILEATIGSLGWTLEPSKTEGPTASLTILGVQVTVDGPDDDIQAHLRCEPAKVAVWLKTIEDSLANNVLTSRDAARLAGRLNFAAGTCFGRSGRGFIRPIYARQYSHVHNDSTLTDDLRHSLHWWHAFLTTQDLHRLIHLNSPQRPVLLVYTDATGSGDLGFATYKNTTHCHDWAATSTPPALNDLLLPRETQVNAHETIAAFWAVANLMPVLPHVQIHLFIDNTTAQAILTNGTSSATDLNHLAAAFWLMAAANDADILIFRVASKANPADAPSRGQRPPGATGPPCVDTFKDVLHWLKVAGKTVKRTSLAACLPAHLL